MNFTLTCIFFFVFYHLHSTTFEYLLVIYEEKYTISYNINLICTCF